MSLAVILPDVVRAAAVFAAVYTMVTVPLFVWRRTRTRHTFVEVLFITGIDILLLGRIMQIFERFGDSALRWWGAPLTLIACLCLSRSTEVGLIRMFDLDKK